jgi:predicted DNA repair protein MutK
MAGASLLTLLDDIASVLDDVAAMTKVAAKQTSGVLGDDLALNAEQVSGVNADRELPVVWAVAVGSMKNKVILVPLALALSALAPWAISPLLMLGGAYLCFEGFEKLAHKYLHSAVEDQSHHEQHMQALQQPGGDMVAFEKDKIRGAIRTDFVLSAEIIIITLGTVAGAAFLSQVAVVSLIAVIMTIGVYGFVAGIVKMDDVGFYLKRQSGKTLSRRVLRRIGDALLVFAPRLMKALAVIGTVAMFMVGGGILAHGLPLVHHLIESAALALGTLSGVGAILAALTPWLLNTVAGVVAGALVLLVVMSFQRVVTQFKPHAPDKKSDQT